MNAVVRTIVRPCSIVWLTLMGLTLLTFALGRMALAADLLALLVLAIALIKAQLVADRFMGLQGVAGLWRPLIAAYLLALGGAIALAYVGPG